MQLIGVQLAKLHLADIIHGDLTTSNMILRPRTPTPELVLIDFGLSYVSNLVEDKAVDLYVLERAFSSTHPDSELFFAGVLEAYANGLGKEWSSIRKRLDEGSYARHRHVLTSSSPICRSEATGSQEKYARLGEIALTSVRILSALILILHPQLAPSADRLQPIQMIYAAMRRCSPSTFACHKSCPPLFPLVCTQSFLSGSFHN